MPVYVIQAGDGPCKIGHTANLGPRLKTMQTASHVQLRLVAAYEGGEPEERALHAQFAALRIKGEWFNLNLPDALGEIALTPIVAGPAGGELDRPGGSLIRALMKARGLSPEGLAALLGPRAGTVAFLMHYGMTGWPKAKCNNPLAAALGVDALYLKYGRNFVRTPMGRAA